MYSGIFSIIWTSVKSGMLLIISRLFLNALSRPSDTFWFSCCSSLLLFKSNVSCRLSLRFIPDWWFLIISQVIHAFCQSFFKTCLKWIKKKLRLKWPTSSLIVKITTYVGRCSHSPICQIRIFSYHHPWKYFVSWFRTFVACLNQMFCRLVHKKFHIFPHFPFLNSNFHCCRCRRQRWHWERKQFRKSNSMAIIILIFTSVPINCTRNMVSTARVFSCITVWPIIYVDFTCIFCCKMVW